MKTENLIQNIGFLGAGGIARAHAFSIKAIRFYYSNPPEARFEAVASATGGSRKDFAMKYDFKRSCSAAELFSDSSIDTVYILGPNNTHFEHFRAALSMPSIRRIYIEKPVCSSQEQEEAMKSLAASYPGVHIQTGFQYLFTPAVRDALRLWSGGIFGRPLHFSFRYFHGDYLRKEYRDRRQTRLTPAPDGGAMADLGSHALSMLLAFLGNDIHVSGAVKAGSFSDVSPASDLFSQVLLADRRSGASGSLAASRIASGTGDLLDFEIHAEKGALRYSSHTADYFEYFLEDKGTWTKVTSGSSYAPITAFPSAHVPPGWLRPMIHAHYVFLTGRDSDEPFIPGLSHALDVQRLIRTAAAAFRDT
ncbi:MAG: Gfo/Idh/MocA family oxidoreductase [Bacteroidales bacterium]|jgi:predicted dehydrogenase|nr:Gfo/Idh/MocA family oxidoreductase [Bacteroidales bacterium]